MRVGSRVFDVRQLAWDAEMAPSAVLTRFTAAGFYGEDVDVENARAGRGGQFGLSAALRPADHLAIEGSVSRRWLDVRNASGDFRRLFTAEVGRLKLTYNFDARSFLRVIAEYVGAERDRALYRAAVTRREGALTGSVLFAFKVNWQSVLFLGYGEDRARDEHSVYSRQGRQFFLKVAYAFAR